jgi:hypothetical protein
MQTLILERCFDRFTAMPSQHVANITNADTKHIERGNGQFFDLYQVHDSEGKIRSKKPDRACSMIGQQATIIRHEQKQATRAASSTTTTPTRFSWWSDGSYVHPMITLRASASRRRRANAGWNSTGAPQPGPARRRPDRSPRPGVPAVMPPR